MESESNAADLVFRPLFSDELKFLVSPMHPWAAKRRASAEEIGAESLILYNKNSYTFRLVDKYFRDEGIELKNVIELGSMEAIKELVKIGMGAGVLAPWIARDELTKGVLVSVPLGKRKLKRRWGVSFRRGRKLPLAEETFAGLCEAVTQDFGRVVAGHLGLDQGERVLRSGDGLCARGLAGLRRDANLGGLRSADEDLARSAADEAIARELFAALDGFEQVGRASGLELGVGGDGCLEVRHQVGVNRDDVALGGEFKEVLAAWENVHGGKKQQGTVTDFARLRGLSTSQPRSQAM